MKRAFLIILLAVGLAGCQSQTPTVDPFFGRTNRAAAADRLDCRTNGRSLLSICAGYATRGFAGQHAL